MVFFFLRDVYTRFLLANTKSLNNPSEIQSKIWRSKCVNSLQIFRLEMFGILKFQKSTDKIGVSISG